MRSIRVHVEYPVLGYDNTDVGFLCRVFVQIRNVDRHYDMIPKGGDDDDDDDKGGEDAVGGGGEKKAAWQG